MIDWTRVAELKDEVGADDFSEVVELFLEEADEVVNRLTSHPDETTLEADLHSLKGSALNLGFAEFATLCATGETLAKSGAYDQIDLGAIVALYRATRQTFVQSDFVTAA